MTRYLFSTPALILESDLVGLLNGDATAENAFWIGDGFWETNSRAAKANDIALGRAIAKNKLRLCVDQWIDSGRKDDGQECTGWRTEKQARDAVEEASFFWRTSRFERHKSANGWTVRALPLEQDSFDAPVWKARRAIAAMLDGELRLSLSKCRYGKCVRPYFILRNRHGKVFEHGLFCSTDHNNRANYARHSLKYRRNRERTLLRLVARCFLRTQVSPTARKWTREYKLRLRREAERKVSMRWITSHKDEIVALARKMNRREG